MFTTINAFAAPLLLSYDGKVVEYNGQILSLKVNGDTVQSNVSPIILDDRTLVPARAIFEKLGASVDWSAEQQKVFVSLNNFKVELKLNDTNALVNGNSVTMDVPAKLINDSTMIPARFVAEQLNMKVGWIQNENLVSIDNSKLSNIVVEPSKDGNIVNINLDFFQNYKVFTLQNPARIVIDFPNINAPVAQQKIDVNSGTLQDVRFAKFQDSTGYSAARVVMDIDPTTTYKVDKNGTKLVVSLTGPAVSTTPRPSPSTAPVTTPTPTPTTTPTIITVPTPTSITGIKFNNVTYSVYGDRVYFKLNNGDLAYLPSQDQKKYFDFYENDGNRYVIRYKKELADLGEGVMNINDSFFSTVEFIKDDGQGYSRIIFNCKAQLTFQTFQRVNYDNNYNYIDTVIDVFVPYKLADKLVVIDPGHGGFETGAYSSGLAEKNLNLDIALKVNNLLKAKGVKTYIIRSEDTYVDLYERAILANKMNASLFVSIHNNSFNGSAYGTESLYYTAAQSGFTSKKFAEILQNKMVSYLGTNDRGVIIRPNLVVLNRTQMLATLVEVGFIDNADEKANLMRDDYKQKAAQAICDGIIESLSKIK